MPMGKFIIRQVNSGLKFDLKAANGQTVLTSEVYTTRSACDKGIASVAKNAPIADVEDQTEAGFKALKNPKFEVYKDKKGEFRFRLKAKNGQIIAVSEGYTTMSACDNGIASVKTNAPIAPVEDQTVEEFEACKNPKFEVYTDKAGEFRFRLKAKNGQIIATGEGYKAKKSCLNGIESIRKNADSPIVYEE